jgi:outer membrane biosynthesis protein TonB
MFRSSSSAVLILVASLAQISAQAPAVQPQENQLQLASVSALNAQTGTVDIPSDTQGVDFAPYLKQWHAITEKTWQGLMPAEVHQPASTKGVVAIRYKIMPNGRVADMVLEGPSGTVSLDRAAWGAITGSTYPALPGDFHGPYIELRARFLYNTQQ